MKRREKNWTENRGKWKKKKNSSLNFHLVIFSFLRSLFQQLPFFINFLFFCLTYSSFLRVYNNIYIPSNNNIVSRTHPWQLRTNHKAQRAYFILFTSIKKNEENNNAPIWIKIRDWQPIRVHIFTYALWGTCHPHDVEIVWRVRVVWIIFQERVNIIWADGQVSFLLSFCNKIYLDKTYKSFLFRFLYAIFVKRNVQYEV